jgi:hypothetical protein
MNKETRAEILQHTLFFRAYIVLNKIVTWGFSFYLPFSCSYVEKAVAKLGLNMNLLVGRLQATAKTITLNYSTHTHTHTHTHIHTHTDTHTHKHTHTHTETQTT